MNKSNNVFKNAYQNSFENNEVAPLCKYNDGWLMELWHGPTSAFKDVALTLLPHLLTVDIPKPE